MGYSTDHTGPNTQFGGLHGAYCALAYHPSTSEKVAADPLTAMRATAASSRNAIASFLASDGRSVSGCTVAILMP